MEENYKERDRKSVLEYIAKAGNDVPVRDILEHSGADKLRVYSLLFELTMEKRIEVVEEEKFGAPKIIRLTSQ